MARNIVLTLGLVSIPVKVDKAADDDSGPEIHTVCDDGHDPARIRQRNRCPVCQNEESSTFRKAHPTEDGRYIVADADKIKEAATIDPALKAAMNLAAHPLESVLDSTLATGKVYNLLPGKGVDPSTYATIVEAIRQAALNGTALTTVWAYVNKPVMYMLQARKDLITAHQLAWPEQVRPTATVEGTANEGMVQQFLAAVSMSATEFDPEAYRDNRAASVEAFLSTQAVKDSGDPDTETPAALPAGGTNVADQLAAMLGQTPTPTTAYDQMSKAELQKECEDADLPTGGTKADLIARLKGVAA